MTRRSESTVRPGWKLAGVDIKRANTAACAVALRDRGPSSIAGIAEATELSRVTVETILDELVSTGLVLDEGIVPTPGAGRPARRFEFAASFGVVVGVDLGAHRSRVVVSDLVGDVLATSERSSDARGGALRPDELTGLVEEAVSRAGVERVLAIAVSVTGLVSEDGRIVVSDNLGDWVGANPATLLSERYSCPVVVDNDTRLATAGEHRMGIARGCESVVYFHAGHRFSVGSVVNGRVLRGSHYAVGEVGGVLFSPDRANAEWKSAATAKDVLELAALGDVGAEAEVREVVGEAARGLAAIVMLIDPEIVVIGGGLSQAGEALLRPIRAAVAELVDVPVEHTMVTSPLGADAPLIGALTLAYDLAAEPVFEMPDVPLPDLASSSLGRGIGARAGAADE
ncbi:ROK family transcriptional regulator [Tsukamurella strandjordii]|uniref:ROK family transcriptional regulator n=1 Tax=Tsukamurella strandjordii TaxID=147577 RepID=UPI0031D350A8